MGCEGPSLTSPSNGMENRLENSQTTTYLHANLEKRSGFDRNRQGWLMCVQRIWSLWGISQLHLRFCYHHTDPGRKAARDSLLPRAKPDPSQREVFWEVITRESVSPPGWEGKTSISVKGCWVPGSENKMRNCCFGSESHYPSSCWAKRVSI